MPYINAYDGRRGKLICGEPALSAGELNYQIFYYVKHNYTEQISVNGSVGIKIIKSDIAGFVEQFLGAKPNYQRYNDMTGALIRCSKEIQRRLGLQTQFLIDIMLSYDEQVAKYEDIKIEENGDVE
jgi:hypothetical protein